MKTTKDFIKEYTGAKMDELKANLKRVKEKGTAPSRSDRYNEMKALEFLIYLRSKKAKVSKKEVIKQNKKGLERLQKREKETGLSLAERLFPEKNK